MKKYIYSLWFILAVAVLAACQDDLEGNKVESGLPAKLSLKFEVPASHKVTNSRTITDGESEVKDLVLIMVETGSKRVKYVDLTNYLNLSSVPTSNGGRTYTLNADYESPTLSGTYNIYAIANKNSSFANLPLNENTAKGMTEAEIQELIATNSNNILTVGATTCPMTGVNDFVTIEPQSVTKLEVSLERAVSHIEFNFINGSSTVDGKTINANFTPQYYTVYNLPETGYMYGNENGNPSSTTYFNSTQQSIEGTSFEFMMLENIQEAKSSPSTWTYNDREAWSGTAGASATKKNFTYAPEKGTFVVVSGTYEDESYVGEVSYTIHLGDFSDNDYSNFTVGRNEYHTYSVTVNGVKNITVEAKKEGLNNGAEGELTKKEGVTFILDAHYETVLVKIPTDKVILTETDDNKNFVKFRTPKTSSSQTVALSEVTNEDINWIQFAKPNGSNGSYTFPLYKNHTKIKGLIEDIIAGNSTYYQMYNGYYYTVAFVDEYYYDDLELNQFVNADNRFFIFNPTPVYESEDGNSIFNSDSGFQIWQRSIKTTYNLSSDMNAFGIETWDETGALPFGFTYENNSILRTQGNLDGYANTKKLIGLKNNESLSSSILSNVGYLKGVEDNTRESHVWGTYNTSDGTVTSSPVSNAIQACLARNRDLDGSGTIDLENINGENELKWYIPALYQYFIIWLGEELLPGDTRLFPTADFSSSLFMKLGDKYPRLYTSSSNSKRTYWPDQGAAWAVIYQYGYPQYADNWMGDKQALRCCRNLFEETNSSTAPSLPAIYVDNVVVVSGIEYVRNNVEIGYLGKHDERSVGNYLPAKFEVSTESLDDTYKYNTVINGDILIENLEAAADEYNESYQGDSEIKWRIPNQRELMLMVMFADEEDYIIPPHNPANKEVRPNYLCTTWFSNDANRITYMYDLGGAGQYNANMYLPSGTNNNYTYVVRFVRDYTGEVEGLTSSSYDAAYGQGGTGAGVE